MVKITYYDKRISISIVNLVETTWLSRYTRPTEIAYDQGSESIDHEFRKSLIKMEYGIISNPNNSVNPTSNKVLEGIYRALWNIVTTYNIK